MTTPISKQIIAIGDAIHNQGGREPSSRVIDAGFCWDLGDCAKHLEDQYGEAKEDTTQFFLWVAEKTRNNQLGEILNTWS